MRKKISSIFLQTTATSLILFFAFSPLAYGQAVNVNGVLIPVGGTTTLPPAPGSPEALNQEFLRQLNATNPTMSGSSGTGASFIQDLRALQASGAAANTTVGGGANGLPPGGGMTVSGAAEAAGSCTVSGFVGNATKGALGGIVGRATSWLKNTLTKGITSALGGLLPGTAPKTVPVNDDKTRENTGSIRQLNADINNKEVGIGSDSGGSILSGIGDLIKPPSLDALAFCIANEMIQQIMKSTIQWVNSGFKGKPVFVDNPEMFFKNFADQEAGLFIQQLFGGQGGIDVCQPLRAQIAVDSIRSYNSQYGGRNGTGRCTLTSIQNNYESFLNNWDKGGLNGWFQIIQKPNNIYGARMQAQAELQKRISQRQNTLTMELNWAKGYKNFKYCDGPKRADGSCDPRYEKTGTPGQIIEESINQRLNSPQHRLEIADEFDELVSALVNQLIKTAISEVLNIGSNSGGSGSVVNNNTSDTVKPTVSITAPVNNASVSGVLAITATSTDNKGVTSVQFRVNGGNVQNADTVAPYSINLNTLTIPNGTHTLTAIARDAAGNTQTSAPVIMNVANFDTTPPTISITAPVSGTASGTILISASASDNGAVYGVQFKLNGANLQAEDTYPSYGISWNSTTVANGSYQIVAVARDMAGNRASSTPFTLTIANTNP